MSILRKVSLCAAGCNLGYLTKTLLALIAFDYMILTFKVKRSAKNTRYFLETCFLSFVSMATTEDSRTLLSLLVIDRLNEHIQVLLEK